MRAPTQLALILLALILPLGAWAQPTPAPPTPMQRTEGLIIAFKAVKTAPEGKALAAADVKANAEAFKVLDGYLLEESITSAPLKPHLKAFSAAQLTQFKTLFWKTLRLIAYPDSGVFFKTAKYALKVGPKVDGAATVTMHAELEEEDIELDVIFFWTADSNTLRLSDISFDGARLSVDYQNQFGRIIKKSGAKGLIDAIQKKYTEASAAP